MAKKASAGTEDHSKLSIIEKEYDIPIEGNLREDVSGYSEEQVE